MPIIFESERDIREALRLDDFAGIQETPDHMPHYYELDGQTYARAALFAALRNVDDDFLLAYLNYKGEISLFHDPKGRKGAYGRNSDAGPYPATTESILFAHDFPYDLSVDMPETIITPRFINLFTPYQEESVVTQGGKNLKMTCRKNEKCHKVMIECVYDGFRELIFCPNDEAEVRKTMDKLKDGYDKIDREFEEFDMRNNIG